MEPLSFFPVTVASVLANLTSPDVPERQIQISTHFSPEIAGLWELDLNSIPDMDGDDILFNRPETDNQKSVSDDKSRLDALKDSAELNGKTLSIDQKTTIRVKQTSQAQSSCKERYNFAADNEMITISGQEWTYSEYFYQQQVDSLPIIVINTMYDNNKTDCSGKKIDQTGDIMIAFVDYKPSNNEMRWCIDPQGEKCFMTFHKLNP